MQRYGDWFRVAVPGLKGGQRYGYRADGTFDPEQGLWFDPAKLLVDPYAVELDRPFRHDRRLTVFGEETCDLVPRAILRRLKPVKVSPPLFQPGGLIYEVAVRPFTILHQDIPEEERGTVRALAHPAVIAHLKRLQVSAVELMPITAWIDERHLPPLGLSNGWGYNPIALMALDPRLCPGGMEELRETVAALHAEGIGVILDLVFNHTGESDRYGATLSLRGLDNRTAFRHVRGDPSTLINDTGTGNTIACDHPVMRQLIIDCLQHFVDHAGVDGFRFDLAPVLLRTHEGFDPDGETARALLSDPVLYDRVLIAEPWDIGPGGYQLGRFPERFLEWNDRARDNLRKAWRGDWHMTGALATAVAGSSDVFAPSGRARGVTFLAAHDGFTLMDLVSHAWKHNEANGEENRDGHDDNHSWNNGVEGETDDPAVLSARRADVKALLSTLFATKGTIMLTAGDEGGRSQRGNNNAYAQDNPITWLDWSSLDEDLVEHAAFLARLRARFSTFSDLSFFSGHGDVEWLHPEEGAMHAALWDHAGEMALGMIITTRDRRDDATVLLAVLFNRGREDRRFRLPERRWFALTPGGEREVAHDPLVEARSVQFFYAKTTAAIAAQPAVL
jgi:glycogen operon protein